MKTFEEADATYVCRKESISVEMSIEDWGWVAYMLEQRVPTDSWSKTLRKAIKYSEEQQ